MIVHSKSTTAAVAETEKAKMSGKKRSERTNSVAPSESPGPSETNSQSSAQEDQNDHSSITSERSEDIDMNKSTDSVSTHNNDQSSIGTPPPQTDSKSKKRKTDSVGAGNMITVPVCVCSPQGPPFVEIIKKCQNSQLFKDMSLKGSDELVMRAHKVVVVPQSETLTKLFTKSPTKKDVNVPFTMSIIKAAMRYMYTGGYSVDVKYTSDWNLDTTSTAAITVEYHLKVLQLAVYLGVPKLESLASQKLKSSLTVQDFDEAIYAKLQEVPKKSNDKKASPSEVPFGVTLAVIEGRARQVKIQLDSGVELNEAFHNVARSIDSRFLAHFIHDVGKVLNQSFQLFLRCPNCGCHILAKEEDSKDFVCIRDDCGRRQALGLLISEDRSSVAAAPTTAPTAQNTLSEAQSESAAAGMAGAA